MNKTLRPFDKMRGALVLVVPLTLIGCAVGPEYQAPVTSLASGFRNAPAAQAPSTSAVPMENWWEGYRDPVLTRLVERVASQNLDLAQASARIRQSRAAALAAGAALMPSGQFRASDVSVKQSLLDPTTVVSRGSPNFERNFNQEQIGFVASWELDLFGGLRRSREAAQADLDVAMAGGDAVRVAATAEAVDAYMQLRGQQVRLAVARQQEATEERLLDLVVQRVNEGLSAEREMHQTRAILERIRASFPLFDADIETQLQRLAVLTGGLPEEEREALVVLSPLPVSPSLPLNDGPVSLLRRRPDVIAAERRVAASSARIGSSISEYYPKVSLSALLGFSSIESGQLLSSDANQRQLGLGLRWRVFDFGRVDAEVELAKGREAEAIVAYRAVILRASAEVETSLSQLVQQERRIVFLQRELDELGSSRRQALAAYDGGSISLLEVLDADQQVLRASDDIAVARIGSARASVAAFRALGGGWQSIQSQ